MFTLANSCLTTSNLPWFMNLTFQVPMQYCSLQHQTLLLSPVTSITWYCFCFGSIPSFFLELCLYWSPVAYWAPTDLGSSSFSVLSFCLFILFMGFSRTKYLTLKQFIPLPAPWGSGHYSPLLAWPALYLACCGQALGKGCFFYIAIKWKLWVKIRWDRERASQMQPNIP